ncbi:hypothetical protein [Clostridium algidicarnis]|uniref:Niacin transporter n=1 Tax=Clostridium algidicarnis DSM 15099 TaxID=1121295 RepID=A0A2S6FWP3_9CLOT|nr:hypothetical protein [Clostridium algidicarnis]MBB6632198.1 ECF transporter S component [Clostridium algidicarnis]MBB6697394.1 ECF transporter S component [Clostridium algidicarnis]MBU3202663.1 ECF transporter S component [Clostridium algidicarnis]MBU3210817.1 ECF transporter S component [Clostridium algidicarnis]MBU3222675.1 ECF transporter S component [Clostridium algidicarnis]
MDNKLEKMVLTSIFIAFSIIIPIQFGFLRINIPPFSATLASHVPMFFSMLISPASAIVVGVGSAVGFLLAGTPLPVVARASMHIIVGFLGATAIKRGISFKKVVIITSPIHGILEALAVIPFVGFNAFYILVVVMIGTMLHHIADGAISYVLLKSLSRAMKRDMTMSILKQ